MEKEEKALLEELKFFDMNNLYQKGSYVDFNFRGGWTPGYILKVHSTNKYDLSFQFHPSDIKNVAEINSNYLGFLGEHTFKNDIDLRNFALNTELYRTDIKQVLQMLKLKLKKSNVYPENENKEKRKSKKIELETDNKQEKNEENNDSNRLEQKEKNENIEEKDTNDKKENNKNNLDENENKNIILSNEEKNVEGKVEENNEKKEDKKEEEIKDVNIENKKDVEKIQEEKDISTSSITPKNTLAENDSSNSSENNTINSQKEKEQNNIIESKNKDKEIEKNVPKSLTKTDKNGKIINISGYYTFQVLGGFLIDCFMIIKAELPKLHPALKELFELCLDTIIYISNTVKLNLPKLKPLQNNRKLIIVSQMHAILASFEIIINNFQEIFQYKHYYIEEILKKLKTFANICHSILIESQKINALPVKLLMNIIKFVGDENVNCFIDNYDENKVYKAFLSHIENLTENELKNIKSNESMKNRCIYAINMIFGKSKIGYINTCYNSYLVNCLRCNNLEKKMNALNDINEIIENNSNFEEGIDKKFYEFFIKKNKILDVFFEEGVHEEILKRASIIFKYLASYNKLENDVLDKLIKEQRNDAMKNILCDVIPELPPEKKKLTFNHLVQSLNFDESKTDIEYISRLTNTCLENENYKKLIEQYRRKELQEIYDTEEEEEDKNEDEENQNYYGLTLLFDYMIKTFNEKKPIDKNNVNLAIEAFNHTMQFSNSINEKDVLYFMDLLLDNIKSNEKHNSVIQSIILIKKLLIKLYGANAKEIVIKKLNQKYNIISLIVNDLIRYINIIQNENNLKIDDAKIYEGIYPHKSNIEERLDIIFLFNRYKQCELKLDMDNLKKLYILFKPKIFKKEMQKFLNLMTKNLYFIEKEIIHSFFKDIILNPNEFDIVNFEDLNALSLLKDLFYKINHDSKTIEGSGKKIRVISQDIQGLNFLFDILINNKNKLIQRDISKLLCYLCLNLYEYKGEFPKKYWKFFIDKTIEILVKLDKENNTNKLNGIISLIDLIYSNSCNYDGDIPSKEDKPPVGEDHEMFQIQDGTKKNKDYSIYVGSTDCINLLRWKCGYFYDIPVNNVVLVDKNNKKYNFINDNENFFELFPPSIYSPESKPKGYAKIKVIQEKNILLTIPGNPKTLIEENENLLQILIKYLSADTKLEDDIKQKIYNIINKMPKKLYIEQNIKIFGSKEKVSDETIKKNLNYENIYILSYFLQCFNFYIKNEENANSKEKNEESNEFLSNFIYIQNGERIFINLLLKAKIDYDNISLIQVECITNLINLIKFFNDFKKIKNPKEKNFEYIHNNVNIDELIKKLSEIIISILKIKYDEINNYNFTNNISNYRNLFISEVSVLLEYIILFIDEINSENKTYYLGFLLSNKDIFKDIFLYNYMKCKENKLIEILHTYFIKNIFEDYNLIKIYLEIMFSIDIFKYLIENDIDGDYFRMLTSIMQKFNVKNLENSKKEK